VDKLEWDNKMKLMRSPYNDKHDEYWHNEIGVNKGNTQGVWRTLHGVLRDSARDDAARFLPTTMPSISRSIACARLLLQRQRTMFRAGSRHHSPCSPL